MDDPDICSQWCPFSACESCGHRSASQVAIQGDLVDWARTNETPPASATNTGRGLTATPTEVAGGDGL